MRGNIERGGEKHWTSAESGSINHFHNPSTSLTETFILWQIFHSNFTKIDNKKIQKAQQIKF